MHEVPATDTATVDAHVPRADWVMLSHSHFNHCMDVPYIAQRTGAVVIGTESTASVAQNGGVPEDQDWSADLTGLIDQLSCCRNDLTGPAQGLCPDIGDVLGSLDAQTACLLARMSGSGATAFGLFSRASDADDAAAAIRRDAPDWWVCASRLVGNIESITPLD